MTQQTTCSAHQLVVSRHPAAIKLLQDTLPRIDRIQAELNPEDIGTLQAGDCVYGNLPAPVVATLSARGVRYFHIELQLPLSVRGTELSVQQLKQYGFRLVEVYARLC